MSRNFTTLRTIQLVNFSRKISKLKEGLEPLRIAVWAYAMDGLRGAYMLLSKAVDHDRSPGVVKFIANLLLRPVFLAHNNCFQIALYVESIADCVDWAAKCALVGGT